MKHLSALHIFFWKYRWRLLLGISFIIISNYFAILAPQLTGFVVDAITLRIQVIAGYPMAGHPIVSQPYHDPILQNLLSSQHFLNLPFSKMILFTGIILLILALLRGFFMFLMRQTMIVMSRKIEYDQKNQIFQHYQQLDTLFYKTQSTGDLMSRISEDVSRVRMYTGPAIMYLVNLLVLIALSLFYMFTKDWRLSLYTLAPLPVLAFTIYYVNVVINKKSEEIQSRLSDLTTNAQESFTGIRVIKSYVQESSMLHFFSKNSEEYRQRAIHLSMVEAIYFPSIGFLIGISTLLTIMIGGLYQMENRITPGTIAEFVVYVNMLTFPVSALGWVASMTQRASASQKRINEFLETKPLISPPQNPIDSKISGEIKLQNVSFSYPQTGIQAIKDFNLHILPGQRIAVVGRTGSGKTTLVHLLLRQFDPDTGKILIDGVDIRQRSPSYLRSQIGWVGQDVFLFSDTIGNNIAFGKENANAASISQVAGWAGIHQEILQFPDQYQTQIGERGVTLSGGQKQRVSIARALLTDAPILLFDDCLSAVDAKTEQTILQHLTIALRNKSAIVITHRVSNLMSFDQIIVMDQGKIIEQGTHESLLSIDGHYAELYRRQMAEDSNNK